MVVTHQLVRDPPDIGDLVGAESECYLSEVVIHVVVAVQLDDQDQLPGWRTERETSVRTHELSPGNKRETVSKRPE